MGAEPGSLIRDVERVSVRPDDVIAVRLRERLHVVELERLMAQLKLIWPRNTVVVLDVDAELAVFEWE